jgi:RimJ/RimL family protein N-acetyltransferase
VAERAGFTLEGILRNDCRENDGTLRDTRVYAVISN